MRLMRSLVLVVSAMVLGGAAWALESGRAEVRGTQEGSSVQGRLDLTSEGDGLRIKGRIEGLAPGKHGFHIHEYGDCSDTGKAAGGHYNPHGADHGYLPDGGPGAAHAGDLGNLEAGADGVALVDLYAPSLTLSLGPHPVAGRAFIVHEKEDDFGQPVGNAGGRVGCGCIQLVAPPAPEASTPA